MAHQALPQEEDVSPLMTESAGNPISNVPKSSKTIAQLTAEAMGTMFLVMAIKLCVAQVGAFHLASFPIGFGLATFIFVYGPTSGAHLNPAVTTAIFVQGNTPTTEALSYALVQCAGGLLGGFIGGAIGGDKAMKVFVAPTNLTPGGVFQAFLAEFMITLLLTSAVLHTAVVKDGNNYFGWAIGMTVFVGANAVGGISGGCFNPAVWVGLGIPALFCKACNKALLSYFWLYFAAELLAAAVAGFLFKHVTNPDLHK